MLSIGRRSSAIALMAIVVLASLSAAFAGDNPANTNLAELGLDALLHIQVTSVSKSPEDLFTAGAAAHVISQEELHRSGVTTIADALRTVPGLQVGKIDAHRWVITSRGFAHEFAGKLLVLMDGRSVYAPINAGVFWDVQDTMMQDLKRIEVIRGPGASLWGANAVNGVINIISKSAKDTQGLLVTVGGGSEERGSGGVRYGGKLADNVHYRAYMKYFNRDESVLSSGENASDTWWMARTGFRIDWDATDNDLVTLQGDLYKGLEHQTRVLLSPTPPDVQTNNFADRVAGGNILGRWSHVFSEDSDCSLQLYYDRTERENAIPSEKRDTFDVDFQSRLQCCNRNTILFGAGYQLTRDAIRNGYNVAFSPDQRTDVVFNTYLQDELSLVPDRLRFVFGSKFEHNDYTGFEVQPTARLAWTPTSKQTVWASVSRAVRTPARAEDDVTLTTPVDPQNLPGINAAFYGNRNGLSESLIAYEVGYRLVPHERVCLDLAAFYNDYDRLRSSTLSPVTSTQPPAAYGLTTGNLLKGHTYGMEALARWQVSPGWKLEAAYSYLRMNLDAGGQPDTFNVVELYEGSSPTKQFSLRSSMDLTTTVQFDATVRYVNKLAFLNVSGYVALDLRLAWQITPKLEVAVVGQNLLDDQHPEFATTLINSPVTEVQRSVFAQLTWRF